MDSREPGLGEHHTHSLYLFFADHIWNTPPTCKQMLQRVLRGLSKFQFYSRRSSCTLAIPQEFHPEECMDQIGSPSQCYEFYVEYGFCCEKCPFYNGSYDQSILCGVPIAQCTQHVKESHPPNPTIFKTQH